MKEYFSAALFLIPVSVQGQPGTELTRPNPAADDLFGATVANDGDRVAVGARGAAGNSGAVYLYEFDHSGWSLTDSISIPTEELGARFSDGLALDGDTLFVGASLADVEGLAAGRVFVFEYIESAWVQTQTLQDPNPQQEAWFGVSCAIDGNVAAVGSREDADGVNRSGSVFVYRKNQSGVWELEDKVRAETPKIFGFFGHAVDIAGDRLAVGSIYGNGGAFESGTVRVFDRIGGEWAQTTKLIPQGQRRDDFFGIDLSMHGNRILVGARKNDSFGQDAGAAYIFEHISDTWTHTHTLAPSNPQQSGEFGNKVTLSEQLAAVGAWFTENAGIAGGSCDIFQIQIDRASHVKSIYPDQPTQFGSLGHDVSLHGTRLLLAAYEDDFYGDEAGRAWVIPLTGCLADVNRDGKIEPTDFTAWINAFNNNQPECDQNSDNSCTAADFTAWIANFNAGC